MKLHCPDCGSPVSAEDMDLGKLLAKCRKCDNLFSFARVLESPAQGAADAVIPQRTMGAQPVALLPQPPHIKAEQMGHTWTATWRWFKADYVGLLVFVLFWDAFLVFWYFIAFTQKGPLMMKVFPVLHVAVGVTLTYVVLTGFLNRTTLELTRHELVIRHRPLPWLGNRRLVAAEIEQLFCEQSGWQQNGGHTYRLCAALGEGRKVTLLGGFKDPGEPRYLEQEIEQRLGIKPQPVVGEFRG